MKKWLLVGAIILGTLWLWYSGRLEWIALPALALIGLGAGKAQTRYTKAKEDADVLLEEILSIGKKVEETQEKHDEEVKAIEEKDFSGVPLGDLLDAANARERRRADKAQS